MRICLALPSIACLLLLRKIGYLAKLLSPDNNSISSKVLTSVAIVGPVNVSILQQCRMLESIVGATILDKCLVYPDDTIHLVKAQKPQILLDNILSVISSGLNHPSANFVAMVAGDGYSWCRLWDKALDHGSHGTEQLQRIIRHLTQPVHDNFRCHLCDQIVSTSWLLHICSSHTVSLHSNNLCEQDILDLLIKEHDDIFSIIFPK